MRGLSVFLSACASIGWGILWIYILLRSRLNGLGWVALGEPNDLILLLEVGVIFPVFILAGTATLYRLKRE